MTLPVICTDRASAHRKGHPRTLLAQPIAGGDWNWDSSTGDVRKNYRHDDTWISWDKRHTVSGDLVYHARCPRCGRTPRVTQTRLQEAARMLAQAGKDAIDISYEEFWH